MVCFKDGMFVEQLHVNMASQLVLIISCRDFSMAPGNQFPRRNSQYHGFVSCVYSCLLFIASVGDGNGFVDGAVLRR